LADIRTTGLAGDPYKANVRVIFALWLVHFTGDLYASFVSPLLPVFADVFALSMTQVGLLAGINRFLMFIVQPIAGYFADHYRTRLFILGGPILSLIFIPLVGVAPSFLVLILFVGLGSIGQAMFHPPVAGMISSYAGRHFSFCMSISTWAAPWPSGRADSHHVAGACLRNPGHPDVHVDRDSAHCCAIQAGAAT